MKSIIFERSSILEFLDFFAVSDWLGRPEPYGYNLEKIIFVVICLFLCVFIPLKLKKDIKAAKKVIQGFWIFAVVLDLIKYIFYNAYCIANNLPFSELEFPLWTCSIYLFVVPLSLFNRNQRVKDACNAFICSISMLGGFINFLFPTESLFSFMGLHTFLYHFALLITPIIMLTSGYYVPRFDHFKGAIFIFIAYGIPVFIFNNIFKQDYMFTYDGSWFGPMADLAKLMPHRLVWTAVCVIGHALVIALMILIESKLVKNRFQEKIFS